MAKLAGPLTQVFSPDFVYISVDMGEDRLFSSNLISDLLVNDEA